MLINICRTTLSIALLISPTGLACAQESATSPATATMKAVCIRAPGGVEVLKYEDAPRPEPKAEEVLIRVMAAGVNPVDAKIREGAFGKGALEKPQILGFDVSGVVEKTGAKITNFKKGDPVYAYLNLRRGGGYAEYTVATQSEATAKPKSITHEQAAAVPLAALTAWQALVETGKLSEGQTVLVQGGSGGVGSFAIQIAKARGARVIATASTANQDFLKQLGVDQPIDYTQTKFEDVVKDVDLVLDAVGPETLARSYGVVKKGGMIVSILGPPDETELRKREIQGKSILVRPNADQLAEVTKLIEEKKIKPHVSKVFSLAEAAKAHEAIETRHTRGKIVLKVADAPK